VLRPYFKKKHRGTYILGPPHHHLAVTKAPIGHYHHLIPVLPKHIHAGPPPAVLVRSKPHPYPAIYPQLPKTPPATLYGPPARKPQSAASNLISHPDITQAIFHPQPLDSYSAAAAALSTSQTSAPYASNAPAAYSYGTAPMLTQPYYVPLIPYTSVLGPQQRSDETEVLEGDADADAAPETTSQLIGDDQERNNEERSGQEPNPVLLYKGVRSPMKLHHKPQSTVFPLSGKQMELETGRSTAVSSTKLHCM
jgi:hypothetical protein